jgi:hypothetical protein
MKSNWNLFPQSAAPQGHSHESRAWGGESAGIEWARHGLVTISHGPDRSVRARPGGCLLLRTAGKPARRAKERVVIIGFDGMDATLARRFMDEGKLPNLKKLADSGTFSKLETTQPLGVARGLGQLRDGRERREAQHPRLLVRSRPGVATGREARSLDRHGSRAGRAVPRP